MKKLVIIIILLLIAGCATRHVKENVTVIEQDEVAERVEPIEISQFTLGPEDVIKVFVWRRDELSMEIKIDPYGKINYPLIGELDVRGMTLFNVQERIREGLSEYYNDPVVQVSIVSISSQKVYVLGQVYVPGVLGLHAPMKVIEAISKAGGFRFGAKRGSVIVIRGDRTNPTLIKLDLKAALEYADMTQNLDLMEGDIVYIPSTIISDVARFASYINSIIYPVVQFERGLSRISN